MIRQAVIVGGMSDTEASAMMGFSGTMWPTIKSSDSTRSDWQSERERNTPSLVSQVKMWPTASASLNSDAEAPEEWLARAEQLKAKHKNGNGAGMPLAVAAKLSAWPTPNAAKASSDTTLTCSGDGRETPNKLGWAVATLMWPTARACSATWATITAEAVENAAERFPNIESVVTLQEGVTAVGHSLSPAWVEMLMGFPTGWTSPLTDGPSVLAKRSPKKSPRASRKTARNGDSG